MLAIDSSEYYAPKQIIVGRDGGKGWRVTSHRDEVLLLSKPFHYTILSRNANVEEKSHYTLLFDGISVKANPRTLRKLGATKVSEIISGMISLGDVDAEDVIPFISEDGDVLYLIEHSNEILKYNV